jgi:GT2 family glycosyltransferase
MISVILPSIRPDRVQRTLENLVQCATRADLEILVVADYMPSIPAPLGVRTQWIHRARGGTVDAVNAGYTAASGEHVFITNDETTLDVDCLAVLEGCAKREPEAIYTPRHRPQFNFSYYGKTFAAFPFAHRDVFKKAAYWTSDPAYDHLFDPAYRCFYADPDLSLRAQAVGIPIVEVTATSLAHRNSSRRAGHQENRLMYLYRDQQVFRARWDFLGEFKDP